MMKILIVILLLISGCVSHSPWQQISEDGPWFKPGKKATVYRRTEQGLYYPAPKRQEAFEIENGEKVLVSTIRDELDLLLERSAILTLWPKTGGNLGKYVQRKPPLALYIVAFDPIVLVGVSEYYNAPGEGEVSVGVYSKYLDYIPVAADIPLESTELLIIMDEEGKLVQQNLNPVNLPKTLSIGPGDYIIISRINKRIVVTRTNNAQQGHRKTQSQ